jgi:hypothetical protein
MSRMTHTHHKGLVIGTDKALEIFASPTRMALVGVASLGFVIAGYFMSGATESVGRYSVDKVVLLGWAAMIFFGCCTLLIVWRIFTERGPVVTMLPGGLTDIRVSPNIVPWSAIATLSTWSHSGRKIMIIALKPGEEDKLTLTRLARLTRRANAKLGADGLAVTSQGLKIRYDDLIGAATAYAYRYGDLKHH